MKYKTRLFIILLSLAILAVLNDASAKTTLSQQLARCAELDKDQERLACYDKVARNASSKAGQSQRLDFIQPPATFLDSRLVAVPWKAEYDLTVRGFVKLISNAVMDDGKRVTVQGWSRDKHDYVLNITMRNPVKLRFLPRGSARKNMPMSLLREVTMNGYTYDAGQFIMVIAAMAPDDKTGDADAQSLPGSQ